MEKASQHVVEYNVTDVAIAIMAEKYKGMAITDTASEKTVRVARREVVSIRVQVEARRKELKKDALEYGRTVDTEAKRINALLEPIETRLDNTIYAVEAGRAAVRAEKARIEQERVDEIRAKIADLARMAAVTGLTAESIRSLIAQVEQIDIAEEVYQEFCQEALETGSSVLAELSKALQAQEAVELADAARKAEDERLEKVRLKQEAKDKLIEKTQLEQRAKADELTRQAVALKKEIENQRRSSRKQTLRAINIHFEEDEVLYWKGIICKEVDFVALSDDKFFALVDELKIKIEQYKADAKIQADKDAKEAAERAEKGRLAKEKAEAEEKARQEALRPDKEKIIGCVESHYQVPPPKCKTKKAKALVNLFNEMLINLLEDIGGKVKDL